MLKKENNYNYYIHIRNGKKRKKKGKTNFSVLNNDGFPAVNHPQVLTLENLNIHLIAIFKDQMGVKPLISYDYEKVVQISVTTS